MFISNWEQRVTKCFRIFFSKVNLLCIFPQKSWGFADVSTLSWFPGSSKYVIQVKILIKRNKFLRIVKNLILEKDLTKNLRHVVLFQVATFYLQRQNFLGITFDSSIRLIPFYLLCVCSEKPSKDERLEAIRLLIPQMPPLNQTLLQLLMKHLATYVLSMFVEWLIIAV